ncbi:MAG: hypothetical protein JWP47_2854 [Polaromonas sp.]|jgi:hypothetical protein|nr:hypothetical protein [Polaromonas sp.]
MNSIIVYVDDAAYALQMLQQLRGADNFSAQHPTQWIVVGCAPRVTHRASKWVTNSARENWRGRWADKVFAGIVPWLQRQHGDVVVTRLAQSTLRTQTESLRGEFGTAQVVDARRPRASLELRGAAPVDASGYKGMGIVSYAAAFMGAGLMLAD